MSQTQRSQRDLEKPRYAFSLTLSATELTDEMANAVYELDLDDALIAESDNRVHVDFDVESTNYSASILHAIETVERALPGVKVIEVHQPGEDAVLLANVLLKARGNQSLDDWNRLLGR